MNQKLVHFTQSSIICGVLFSGFFFPMAATHATTSDPKIVLLADNPSSVNPVNPLNPAITVEPIEAPAESTAQVEPIRPDKELENKLPPTRKKIKAVKKKNKTKKEPSKKQSVLKITELTPYSLQTDATLPPDPLSSGGNNRYHQTSTGQLLANLSGCILYGIKK